MTRSTARDRRLLDQAVEWWDSDRTRLVVIRVLAYGLFLASVAATVYSGVRGSLPAWAITLYAFFSVQLVFATFMFAIRRSGQEEIRRALFELRRERVPQWLLERAMLAEFARIAACLAAGTAPGDPRPSGTAAPKPRSGKSAFPSVDMSEVGRLVLRRTEARREGEGSGPLTIDFVAYSFETMLVTVRDVAGQLASAAPLPDGFEVQVRILLRDLSEDADWLVPLAANELADIQYAANLRTRFHTAQDSTLEEFASLLAAVLPPGALHFDVKGYRFEPLVKGILVDRSDGVFGLYTVSALHNPVGWDYSGHAVECGRARLDGNPYERAAAFYFREWFSAVWDDSRLSRPRYHR